MVNYQSTSPWTMLIFFVCFRNFGTSPKTNQNTAAAMAKKTPNSNVLPVKYAHDVAKLQSNTTIDNTASW